MSKKLYAAFVPLLAVVAFAVMPAIAQAQPHWYSNGKRIALSTPVKVTTTGTLTLHALGIEITCKVKDKGVIENPDNGTAGTNKIEEFVNSECVSTPPAGCEKPEILAKGLPWSSVLVEVAKVIRDSISGIKIEVRCKGAFVDEFFGTLTPKIGNSVAEFGAGSGELEDAAKNKATVTGNDSFEGPPGDEKITAKNP